MLEEVESIAIDYFETNGFLVRKSSSVLGKLSDGFYPSLIVRNLKEEEIQEVMMFNFQWFSSDFFKTKRAVVSIVGEALFETGSRALRQDKRTLQSIKKLISAKQAPKFPWEDPTLEEDFRGHHRLVILPVLPPVEPNYSQLCSVLESKGVAGVITFRTLLDNLIQQLEVLEDAKLSPRLKMLRILKQMELLKIPQLDLFD